MARNKNNKTSLYFQKYKLKYIKHMKERTKNIKNKFQNISNCLSKRFYNQDIYIIIFLLIL